MDQLMALAVQWAPLAADIASIVAFAIGAVFLIIGAIGVVRLPDFWARLHGAGIIDTLGAEMILIGMMFQAGFSLVTVKLILIGTFVFLTSPTATHAVANAAYVAGLRPLGARKEDLDVPEAKASQMLGAAPTAPAAENVTAPASTAEPTPAATPAPAPSKKRSIIEFVSDDTDDEEPRS